MSKYQIGTSIQKLCASMVALLMLANPTFVVLALEPDVAENISETSEVVAPAEVVETPILESVEISPEAPANTHDSTDGVMEESAEDAEKVVDETVVQEEKTENTDTTNTVETDNVPEEVVPVGFVKEVIEVIKTNIIEPLMGTKKEAGVFAVDEKGVASIQNVTLGTTYIAPQNNQVQVTFTKLPETPGSLSIEEVILTDEQVKQFGAESNVAYDITSDMANGTFEYDLKLPLPAGSESISKVVYAENVADLNLTSASVESRNVEVVSGSVVVSELDHFTIFVVVRTQQDFAGLTWTPDRAAPTGGWVETANTLTMNIDASAQASGAHERTEGVQATIPAGKNSVKTTLFIDPNWSSVNYVRAGLWGKVARVINPANADTAWPIMEFVNDGNAPRVRVYDTMTTGLWTDVATVTYGDTVDFEVRQNPYTDTFEFYLDDVLVKSYSSVDGTDNYKFYDGLILNAYNNGGSDYEVTWSNLKLGVVEKMPELVKAEAYFVKDAYKGFAVDIKTDNLLDATEVKAEIFRENGSPVVKTNKSTGSVLAILNTGNIATVTLPIVIQQGTYNEAGSSSWNQPLDTWDHTNTPTKIVVTITRSGGSPLVKEILIGDMSENLALLSEVMPLAQTMVAVRGDTSAGENQSGWLFNRDINNATPIEFNYNAPKIGDGSLYVQPLSGTNGAAKFIAEYFLLDEIVNLSSVSYDFQIGTGGTVSDANEFYMNVYANFGSSASTKYFDCKYDIVPTVGVVGGYTTVTFDPTQAYPVTKRADSPYNCPSIPADMNISSTGSTIRMFALNVGDTSLSDAGLDGYFDKVVVAKKTEVTTFDFEAAPLPACSASDSVGNTTFDTFALGNVSGQNGWNSTGPFDQEIVRNTYGYIDFGCQSLRISNAVTSGSFGDQTFAAPLADSVGEAAATAGTFTEGTRRNHYEAQFDIASAVPGAQQNGLSLSVSPDRGDGSRMSYLSFVDGAAGIDVTFYDVAGTTSPVNFVSTNLGTLNRTVPHSIKFIIDAYEGAGNDKVQIFIDGSLVHTGTTWENYYRYDNEASAEQSPRLIKSIIFRAAGAAVAGNDGKGFLLDNMSLTASDRPALTPPTVTIESPTPAENSYVKGQVIGRAVAIDENGMGSSYLRFWKDSFESGIANLAGNCQNAPGADLLGKNVDTTCTLDTTTVADGVYVFSAQFLDSDTQWGKALRTFTVDNTKPIGVATYNGGVVANDIISIKSIDELSFTETIEDNNNVVRATYLVQKLNTVSNTYEAFCGNWNASGTGSHALGGSASEVNTVTNIRDCQTDQSQWTNGTYKIFHAAYDAAGNEGKFNTNRQIFVIDNIAPSVPVHQTPANNGFQKINDFYFEWTDSVGAVEYEFQSSQNPSTDSNGALDNAVWNNKLNGSGDQLLLTDSRIHSVGANGTWYWQVRSIDQAGNKSDWTSPWKTTIDIESPATNINVSPVVNGDFTVSGVATDNISLNRVYVQLVNRQTNARVGGTTINLIGTGITSPWSVQYDDLPEGDYAAHVSATDMAGNSGTAGWTANFTVDNTITTPPTTDTTPPVVTAINSLPTTTQLVITWTTDEPATSQVEYGETNAYGTFTPLDNTLTTNHSVTITGLNPGTQYYFQVISEDSSGNGAREVESASTGTIITPPTNNGGGGGGIGAGPFFVASVTPTPTPTPTPTNPGTPDNTETNTNPETNPQPVTPVNPTNPTPDPQTPTTNPNPGTGGTGGTGGTTGTGFNPADATLDQGGGEPAEESVAEESFNPADATLDQGGGVPVEGTSYTLLWILLGLLALLNTWWFFVAKNRKETTRI